MLGDYNRNNVQLLENHFRRQTGVESVVEERRTHGIQHAKELFTALMAVRIDWDTANTYMAWRYGTKGAKLVQGKGAFHRITGGSKGSQANSRTDRQKS